MADLEVGHLGLVAGLDENLVAVLDELGDAAAQDVLLTEQVGLGLLAEGGLNGPGAGAANGLGVGQHQRPGGPGGVLLDADQHRHAAPGLELAAHGVAGALGGDHNDVVVGGGLNVAEVDIEAVGEEQRGTGLEVGLDLVAVQLGLDLVRGQDRHDVGPGHGLGDRLDGQPGLLGLGDGAGALTQAHHDLHAGVPQVEGMGVALGAVADDRDLLGLDDAQVRVVVVELLSCHNGVSLVLELIGDGSGAARNSHGAGLDDLLDPVGAQGLQKSIDLRP